jgi:hypothetical protein
MGYKQVAIEEAEVLQKRNSQQTSREAQNNTKSSYS